MNRYPRLGETWVLIKNAKRKGQVMMITDSAVGVVYHLRVNNKIVVVGQNEVLSKWKLEK